jgi:Tol biopolymer transport system component
VLLEDDTAGWVSSTYVTGATSAAPEIEESITNAATASVPADSAVTADSAAAAATTATSATAVASATAATSATGLTGTIVYQTSPGGTFYAYDLETGAQWPLTTGWDPAISPDGQTVAFVRGGGETGIWLIDIDGSNERLIYGERRDLSSPKWSPDGTYIVFGRGDSYITCRQIGRECLPDSVWLDRNPNMDLDGFPLIDEYLQNLARIDVDGNNYRDLATLESAREPDWSSAGIVYASSDGLQITDDTAGAVNRVVYFEPLQARDQDPDWAGDRIIFVTRQSSHYQIFSVNSDGTGKTSLTRPVTTLVDQIPSNVAPAFSPDGSQIVFLSNRGENNEAGEWRLWVMNADGSDQRMLETIAPIAYHFNNMEQAVSWGG